MQTAHPYTLACAHTQKLIIKMDKAKLDSRDEETRKWKWKIRNKSNQDKLVKSLLYVFFMFVFLLCGCCVCVCICFVIFIFFIHSNVVSLCSVHFFFLSTFPIIVYLLLYSTVADTFQLPAFNFYSELNFYRTCCCGIVFVSWFSSFPSSHSRYSW